MGEWEKLRDLSRSPLFPFSPFPNSFLTVWILKKTIF